jgi:hypothetical protein
VAEMVEIGDRASQGKRLVPGYAVAVALNDITWAPMLAGFADGETSWKQASYSEAFRGQNPVHKSVATIFPLFSIV